MEIVQLIERARDSLAVGRAFGPAYERDGVLVIPVALVVGGGGGGGGQRGVPPPSAAAEAPSAPAGADGSGELAGGEGGGFGGIVMPIGVYVVRDGDVRWVPALDMTRLAVAAVGLLRAVTKLIGGRRSKRVRG